ncbi:hypothetical protein Q5424_10475 [Conexibacter sp. JD483]|uniref:hypothetical protein n=1 Tax=unclassified Conexibacter TaxID=2627773 RepID=UPI002719ECF6|nr:MULTISPECIES: hypothetical protein [unclassified Conexibacter]MDO8187811.1 hypothetical protein [Conexibacter sp. CPCC 205706]MDO8199980.1 hypothetical protein [Conexibacter sp. CPCC 205762]MDR9369507.1 hypothetical protein [Conexibacter sp. JD483]
MVVVEIRTPVYDEESGRSGWAVCAMVFADGRRTVSIVDKHGVLDHQLPVVDAVTGRQIHLADDAEAWARNLPGAFRAGDLVAHVLADTNPAEQPPATPTAARPSIPAPPPFTRISGASTTSAA